MSILIEIQEVLNLFPKLKGYKENGKDVLEGIIEIIDSEGIIWDNFQVKIHITDEYPYRFPILFETGDRIPKIADWHIYTNHACCLTVEPNERLVCSKGIRLITYIQEWVIPYLANQAYRIKFGHYAGKEYSHGPYGNIEYFKELFQEDQVNKIVEFLHYAIEKPKLPRTSECFCGSGKKYRKCHKTSMEVLYTIGIDNMKRYLSEIEIEIRKALSFK